ncbi:sugar phosphate isomerase/epimerase [Spirosoma taeanense]|uniref:Sugar phosphate isomerase/epimerase n=2 Tax=Spirosoma taeanense TaxID=2735870 RepID=A0A6M5YG15_9BACT|nr:sugar phosphate isomerase/epimerase [Spirosoma taeanense]
MENLSYAEAARRVKSAGYDGMEIAAGPDKRKEAVQVTRDNGLDLVLMAFSGGSDFADHKKRFRDDLLDIAAHKPLFINAHTGKDFFTFEQNAELIQTALDVQKQTGVRILHETHRGRFSYSAPAIQNYLLRLPELRLTADYSHWVNVAESYLDDQAENVSRAIAISDHVHCRVGQPEAPQVSDPRAPEWKEALETHARWWDAIRTRLQRANAFAMTITCEFGPAPGYLPTLPYTQQPVVSQWDVNVFMKDYLKKRWQV